MIEFIITRLKRAEHRDWNMSRSGLRWADITGEFSRPFLVEIVANSVGVCPTILTYLNENGKKA